MRWNRQADCSNIYSCKPISQYTVIQDTVQYLTSCAHAARKVMLSYVRIHALPGVVDGAIKTSEVSSWIRGGAWGRRCRLSSLPMLKATSSRDQHMSVLPATGNLCRVRACL